MSHEEAKKEFKRRIYKLILDVLKFCGSLPKDIVSRKICEQLVRSGTSIGANYFEVYSASSKKDYANYFHIALKSSNESIFWISLLRDSDKIGKEGSNKLLNELQEIAKIFASSLLTMKGKKNI